LSNSIRAEASHQRPGNLKEIAVGELEKAVRQVKAFVIDKALRDCHGNKCWAAKQLGIHRNTLQRQMDDLGVFDPEVQRKYRERSA
jgi:transcriptional regulator with PAS, ATPase and Fis domain